MTVKAAIEILRIHNEWRRGEHSNMGDITQLGIAIDTVIEAYSKAAEVGGEEEVIAELQNQLETGRNYLMGTEPEDITPKDALQAFGFGENGLQ